MMLESTLTIHFHQRFGAFDRIISLLRRRGFPIAGMTIERTHRQDLSRMTVTVGDERCAEQVLRHLAKLPDVAEVTLTVEGEAVQREYAMARVHCAPEQESEVRVILTKHNARTVAAADGALVVEASGPRHEIDNLFADLTPYGIEESARTSPIALHHTSGAAIV